MNGLTNKICKFKNVFIILFFFLSSCTHSGLTKYYGNSNLVLSEETAKRFIQYIQGDFYSMVYNQREQQVSPLFFYVTEDGMKSLILYCGKRESDRCFHMGVEPYQALLKCEKLFLSRCKVFAEKDYIVWNNNKQKIQFDTKDKILSFLINQGYVEKNLKHVDLELKKTTNSWDFRVVPDDDKFGGTTDWSN